MSTSLPNREDAERNDEYDRPVKRENVLLQDNPADTLDYCAAVLTFLNMADHDRAATPAEPYFFGRSLCMWQVVEALRVESTRVLTRKELALFNTAPDQGTLQ